MGCEKGALVLQIFNGWARRNENGFSVLGLSEGMLNPPRKKQISFLRLKVAH
jgi:hypothetical protein